MWADSLRVRGDSGEYSYIFITIMIIIIQYNTMGSCVQIEREKEREREIPGKPVVAYGTHRKEGLSLRAPSVNIGTMQRRLAWPLRKDDAHKSRSVDKLFRRVAQGHPVPGEDVAVRNLVIRTARVSMLLRIFKGG